MSEYVWFALEIKSENKNNHTTSLWLCARRINEFYNSIVAHQIDLKMLPHNSLVIGHRLRDTNIFSSNPNWSNAQH